MGFQPSTADIAKALEAAQVDCANSVGYIKCSQAIRPFISEILDLYARLFEVPGRVTSPASVEAVYQLAKQLGANFPIQNHFRMEQTLAWLGQLQTLTEQLEQDYANRAFMTLFSTEALTKLHDPRSAWYFVRAVHLRTLREEGLDDGIECAQLDAMTRTLSRHLDKAEGQNWECLSGLDTLTLPS